MAEWLPHWISGWLSRTWHVYELQITSCLKDKFFICKICSEHFLALQCYLLKTFANATSSSTRKVITFYSIIARGVNVIWNNVTPHCIPSFHPSVLMYSSWGGTQVPDISHFVNINLLVCCLASQIWFDDVCELCFAAHALKPVLLLNAGSKECGSTEIAGPCMAPTENMSRILGTQ